MTDIKVRIDIWHGDADSNVPYCAAEYLHDRIPGSRATFLSGDGHMFLLKRWSELLHALVAG